MRTWDQSYIDPWSWAKVQEHTSAKYIVCRVLHLPRVDCYSSRYHFSDLDAFERERFGIEPIQHISAEEEPGTDIYKFIYVLDTDYDAVQARLDGAHVVEIRRDMGTKHD